MCCEMILVMAVLDHWHPVLRCSQLGTQPVAVRLAGHTLAVFRTQSGKIGALADGCPHRRMKLSLGRVCGERLQCTYHGWTFDPEGNGESPGTPKLHATAPSYDACEAHGVIWVKARGSEAALPSFHEEGYFPVCLLEHRMQAPLELVLDNFTEMEHTPTTHGMFGYPLERMHEVQVEFEPHDTTVTVRYTGPCKKYPLHHRLLLLLGKESVFHDTWTTHFSPVYNVLDYHWTDAHTGRESWVRFRLVHFFVPVDDHETLLMTFSFVKLRYPAWRYGLPLVRRIIYRTLDGEIRRDKRVLESLASQETSIEGLKLSRFDRVLGLNRERLNRVYRGSAPSAVTSRSG